ncbi:MAG: DUF1080 domain-containing protein [Patescibacteria group bacterium]|nr:MAG: DUF1080 domain-containing protein [Patescibacteria group bacterium]
MNTRGLTLIETIIGIGIVSMLVFVFAVSLTAAVFAQRIKLRNMAAVLADQQLSALRTYSVSQLSDQTNGPLIGVLFTQGSFTTVVDETAPSQALALHAATSTASGLSAVLPLPKNAYNDFTLTTKLKVNGGSPSSWRAGLLFRGQDLQNHYEAYLTSSSLVLKKVVNGVETTLYSDARAISYGSWQTLAVTTAGSSISLILNGTTVTTVNDATFSVGKAALVVWNGASVNFDDVSIGGDGWDFDTTAIGTLHDDWLRFGLGDLPNGTSTLTVASPYGDTTIKSFTVNVSWTDRSGTTQRTLSQSTYGGN